MESITLLALNTGSGCVHEPGPLYRPETNTNILMAISCARSSPSCKGARNSKKPEALSDTAGTSLVQQGVEYNLNGKKLYDLKGRPLISFGRNVGIQVHEPNKNNSKRGSALNNSVRLVYCNRNRPKGKRNYNNEKTTEKEPETIIEQLPSPRLPLFSHFTLLISFDRKVLVHAAGFDWVVTIHVDLIHLSSCRNDLAERG